MSDWEITSAMAPLFSWNHATGVARVTFAAGSPGYVDVELAGGNYRMHLGPTTGEGKDFIRAVGTAINSAIAAEGRGETCTLAMTAPGLVALTWSDPTVSIDANPVFKVMGFSAGGAGALTAAYPPRHLALFIAQSGGVWQPVQTGATDVTSAGRPYTIGEVTTAYTKRARLDYLPRDPAACTDIGCTATPVWPDRAFWGALGDESTVRRWSLLDTLRETANVLTAVTLGGWETLLTSTTETYDLVRTGKASVRSPKIERADDVWDRWQKHELELWLGTTAPTGTRA